MHASSQDFSIPPVSPYGLIQETLWPDGWKILVACILLNLTTRRAMEKILPNVFRRYPTAEAMAAADFDELSQMVAPLGFRNRRAKNLIDMSRRFLTSNWDDPRDLPGVGEYAGTAWDIFVKKKMPAECPKDGALKKYYNWMVKHGR